ncbi:MAG TPA: aspartate kinase [Prolixibacteraceae bacterium]|nr:aspartate kinase [Prolixibacteraceae bacterium]
MKVFKFGGASVSSSEAVRSSVNILKMYPGNKVLVISAMGKTTNALEMVARKYFNQDPEVWTVFQEVKSYHEGIISELWGESTELPEIEKMFGLLSNRIKGERSLNFDYEYDQIVAFGELISTQIVSLYFNSIGLKNRWVDVRNCLKTDDQYREANINWELSERLAKRLFTFEPDDLYITQGFIGGTLTNQTTTLGREGSDYTAAILANLLDAEEVSIWKNVPGILNADPDFFSNTQKLDELSYKEAIELSYSGAKVIHPKTIKPLQNKNIPLFVKSFLEPEKPGTVIHAVEHPLDLVPVIIVKKNMALITLTPNDFSFISINNVSDVFSLFAKYRLKVGLIQQSAIDLSIAFDEPEQGIDVLIRQLQEKFEVKYNTDLDLVTIRYYTPESVAQISAGRTIYVEQKSRRTARMLLK